MNPISNVGFRLAMTVIAAYACAPRLHGGTVDLLRTVTLAEDQLSGTWKKNVEGGFESIPTSLAKLRLSKPVADDYVLRVKFTRLEGQGPIGVALVRGGKSFAIFVSGKNKQALEGFTLEEDSSTGQNAIKKGNASVDIVNNQKTTLWIKITGESAEARIDGKRFAVHNDGLPGLDLSDNYAIGGGHLGLIALNTRVLFHEVRLVPIKRPESQKPHAKDSDHEAAEEAIKDPFEKGETWSGTYRDSLNGQSSCTMRIEKREGNRVTAKLWFGNDRAVRLAFNIRDGRITDARINDRSRAGSRQFAAPRIDATSESFRVRCDYLLNSRRHKNQAVSAEFNLSRD